MRLGPALFLALAPAWLWAALAGLIGLVVGSLAGWLCGHWVCQSDAGGTGTCLGTQLLAAATLLTPISVPLALLWLVRVGG